MIPDQFYFAVSRLENTEDFSTFVRVIESQLGEFTKELVQINPSSVGDVGRIQGKIQYVNDLLRSIKSAREIVEKRRR